MRSKLLLPLLIAATAIPMAGCVTSAQRSSGVVYNQYSAQRAAETQPGMVLAVKQVVIQTENSLYSGAALAIGGALGAGLGNSIGKPGKAMSTIGTVVGAAGGAVAGSAAAKALSEIAGFEITVRTAGRTLVIVQEQDVPIKPGMCVDIVSIDGRMRVTPGGFCNG